MFLYCSRSFFTFFVLNFKSRVDCFESIGLTWRSLKSTHYRYFVSSLVSSLVRYQLFSRLVHSIFLIFCTKIHYYKPIFKRNLCRISAKKTVKEDHYFFLIFLHKSRVPSGERWLSFDFEFYAFYSYIACIRLSNGLFQFQILGKLFCFSSGTNLEQKPAKKCFFSSKTHLYL